MSPTRIICIVFFGIASSLVAKEQEFRFEKADAQTVDLMAEFNQWKGLPMTRQANGIWTVKVSVSPGTYGYKFLVDGKDWVFDPNNSARKTVNGVENSAIEVTEASSRGLVGTPMPSTAPAAAAAAANSGSLSVMPGDTTTFETPLSAKQRAAAAADGYPRLMTAKVALAVPQGFDPQKTWPILVISNTEAYSNIDSMQQFKQAAIDDGWVIMAADGVETEPKKEGGCREPTMSAAFDYVMANWPKAKDWPVACGGMSGGAKNSAFLAAHLAREHHRIIGMLMMGCNQDMATVAYRKSAPPGFLTAVVFLSSGTSDTIATPAQHEHVMNSLKSTGFRKVRLESHPGGHDIYQPHIDEALKWFVAEAGNTIPAGRPGDSFETFFKKKP
jgi:Glycogen recognition site of AMP-activated protein kinase